MDDTRKVSIWMVGEPDEFMDGLTDLLALGFDLDKNSARDLITAIAEYKGIIGE